MYRVFLRYIFISRIIHAGNFEVQVIFGRQACLTYADTWDQAHDLRDNATNSCLTNRYIQQGNAGKRLCTIKKGYYISALISVSGRDRKAQAGLCSDLVGYGGKIDLVVVQCLVTVPERDGRHLGDRSTEQARTTGIA